MILFTILAFFCLISAFITWGLGFFVFSKNPSKSVNRLFLAVMLAASYWAVGEFLIWESSGYGDVRFWLKASSFWPFVMALTVHFILTYTEHPLSKPENGSILFVILYLPSTVISLIGLFTDAAYTVVNQPGIGYVYLPVWDSPAYQIEALYILLIMVFGAYLCISAWQRGGPLKIRRQNRLLSVGIVTVIVFGAVSGLILPAYGIPFPNLVFIGIVLFTLIITYAIVRYGLFTLSAETAVPDILKTMPDGLVLADMDGRIITVNTSAARIFRVGEKALACNPLETLFPQSVHASISSAIRDQGTFLDLEAVLDRTENTVVSIAGSLIRDPEGEPAGFILIIRDITSRKASERALRVANEKISLLTQLTRHDILNLITALAGFLTLLQETNAGKEGEKYVTSCMEVVQKIDRYLEFSREYQNIGSHQPVWQPVAQMIARAVSDLSHEGITILMQVEPVEIYADPLSVKVFYNLLENALRHGATITQIRVSSEKRHDGELVVMFEDNGAGVRDEDKDRIFQYGFGKHTGLGLALSRDILAVTGISIKENGMWGHGARFEIHIPPPGGELPDLPPFYFLQVQGVRFEITAPKGSYRLVYQ